MAPDLRADGSKCPAQVALITARSWLSGNALCNSKAKKDQFQYNYSQLWLWASDDVIQSTNELLKHQIALSLKRNAVENSSEKIEAVDKTKIIYAKTVLKMRKDLGYKSKHLSEQDYQFISLL